MADMTDDAWREKVMMLEGGCFCGAVRYRMAGPPIYVNCCHCRDCQTLTGSAFALNAMIERDRVTVLQGDPAPDKEGGMRCPACGVLLWGFHPLFGDRILFLRAGTLDESERLKPDAHFFVRSKHPWVTLAGDIPAFDTLPVDERLFSVAQQERVESAMRS